MKKQFSIYALILFSSLMAYTQQTVGLFTNTPAAFDGYTLFSPQNSYETFLINNCGEKVHSWPSEYLPGLSCYLLENGILLRPGRIQGVDGGAGIVEMIDWDGNVIWDYSAIDTHGGQHHDIELLPNGNILLIVRDIKNQAEITQAGSQTANTSTVSEQIIEVQPDLVSGGATVVWEWKVWDHLIQDIDPAKDNYGIIAEKPERVNINYELNNSNDWLHFNGIDYHEDFNQIIISVRNFSEFWIIDHTTTTAEAADSTGGLYGKGGDLLYRWGNPRTYNQATIEDQKLFVQHHAHWIPDSFPGAGKIILFNNNAGIPTAQEYSSINIIDTPVDEFGFYDYSGGAFSPADFDWTYEAPNPTDFFSNVISGVQRLQNGNTLICEGTSGNFFEVDENKNIVWQYINPINNLGPITQNTIANNNDVFRCTRYAPDYPGLAGQSLIPQGYLEIGSIAIDCEIFSPNSEAINDFNFAINIYPNPVNEIINIELKEGKLSENILAVKIININNEVIYASKKLKEKIDVSNFPKGIYFIQFYSKEKHLSKKIIVN